MSNKKSINEQIKEKLDYAKKLEQEYWFVMGQAKRLQEQVANSEDLNAKKEK